MLELQKRQQSFSRWAMLVPTRSRRHECYKPESSHGTRKRAFLRLLSSVKGPFLEHAEGPSTQYLRTLVPKTIPLMVFGTKGLKYWALGVPDNLVLMQNRLKGDRREVHGSNRSSRSPVMEHSFQSILWLTLWLSYKDLRCFRMSGADLFFLGLGMSELGCLVACRHRMVAPGCNLWVDFGDSTGAKTR